MCKCFGPNLENFARVIIKFMILFWTMMLIKSKFQQKWKLLSQMDVCNVYNKRFTELQLATEKSLDKVADFHRSVSRYSAASSTRTTGGK